MCILVLSPYNNTNPCVCVCVGCLTCGSPNCPNKDRGYSHDEAPKSSQEGEDLSVGS